MKYSRTARLVLLILLIQLFGCKGKNKNYMGNLDFKDIRSVAQPVELPLSEDEYDMVQLGPEAEVLLYIVSREVKEGWGLGHGLELISYNIEKNLKLPLGKLGRSTLVKVIQLRDELKNAVAKTVDTDGNGDIDERDANQLYITATYGLEDEPVSPVGTHTIGVWQDPLSKWVVFATSADWEGRRKKKHEIENPIDPTPIVWGWDPETKGSFELARCEKFCGFSPDGLKYCCFLPGQQKKKGDLDVGILDRETKKPVKKVALPITLRDDVLFLGKDGFVFTKHETGETGEKATLWLKSGGSDEQRITSNSVDSRIVERLGDGSVLFTSRSVDSVDNFVVLMAVDPVSAVVKTIYRSKDTDISSLTMAANGKKLALLKGGEETEVEMTVSAKSKIFTADMSEKPVSISMQDNADEYIASLGAAILKDLRRKLAKYDFVDGKNASVNIRKGRVFLEIKTEGSEDRAAADQQLLDKALEIKDDFTGVLSEKKYSGVVYSPEVEDAVVLINWEEKFGDFFTYFSAYGEKLPVRSEYHLFIDDMSFRKMPGCRDPRMVQLHCNGWLATTAEIKGKEVSAECKTVPLNPVQFTRKITETLGMPTPGGEAVEFDVIVDKVDPRRSHRYSYYFDVFVDGKPYPTYDAFWAEASKMWIDMMRGLEETLRSTLLPYSGRTETVKALSTWRPDSVVLQENHLDTWIFLEPRPELPPAEQQEAWQAVAQQIMDTVTEHTLAYDPGRENEVRITLWTGNDLMFELWHKTKLELLADAMMDPNWAPPEPEEEKKKDKGKKKGKGREGEEEEEEDKVESKLPEVRLGLPKAMIDKSEVKKVVSSHLSEVKYCYEKEAAGKDIGAGQISVRMVIGPTGKVESVTVGSATLKNSAVQSCVLNAVKRWKFPVPEGEGSVKVNYPFTFTGN